MINLNLYQQENTSNLSMDSENEKQPTRPLHINASLKSVYRQLKPPLVTQKLFDDLSICIAFQMLLFLANEHVINIFFFIIFIELAQDEKPEWHSILQIST